MRSAICTARQVISQAVEQPDIDEVRELINSLQFYLPSNQPPDIVLTPAEVEARI